MRSLKSALMKAPVPYTSTSRGRTLLNPMGSVTYDNKTLLGTFGGNGTLFGIVDCLSENTAQVEWKLYRKSESGRDEDRKEVTRHLALSVWNKPNDFYTRQELVHTGQQHNDLTGETWWIVSRDSRASMPMELWPCRPDRIVPVPHPTEFLSGYVYLGPDGERIPLKLDEVIQLRRPNPLDPYRGMGPVQTILTDLDSSRYSAEWNRNFFRNSAEPGGIIEVPESLSDGEFREMRDRWNEQHRGVAAAHRVAILEHGKWIDRKFTQRDMQFVELRKASSEVVREAFRFPKPLLGSVDDVNRANADAAEVVLARWLLVPRLERIKLALNNDFLPMFGSTGQGVEFDYCNPVPEDAELENATLTARSTAAAALVTAGYDPTGVLAAVGLPDIRHVGKEVSA